jgi:hypothetical protein
MSDEGDVETRAKMWYSLESALLFAFFANPHVFEMTAKWMPSFVEKGGRPSVTGLAFHSLLFGVVVFLLMENARRKKVALSYGSLSSGSHATNWGYSS